MVPEYRFFGTQHVWRNQTRVQVSDPSKTIVDIISDPALGGGIRHVFDIVKEYFSSEHRDDKKLISYFEKQQNGTAYKRMGYLLEVTKIETPELLIACKKKISKGYSPLDPAIKTGGKYLRQWNLKINVTLEK
jgi:predicted transcriptional regulator of viral defense system